TPRLDLPLLGEFSRALVGRPLFGPGLGMFREQAVFAFLDLALLVGIVCVALAQARRGRRLVAISFATLVTCQTLFLAGVYLLVVGPFGGQLQSFPRYTATMLTAASVLLALAICDFGMPDRTRRGKA